MTCWLGVVSRDHVQRGVALGIAQIGHGGKAGVARMQAGDGLVFYSPRVSLDAPIPLQAFTAIGWIADDEVYQADDGGFRPWRRRVAYRPATEVPLQRLRADLELTQGPNWGHQLRRGLVELSERDFDRIAVAMGVDR